MYLTQLQGRKGGGKRILTDFLPSTLPGQASLSAWATTQPPKHTAGRERLRRGATSRRLRETVTSLSWLFEGIATRDIRSELIDQMVKIKAQHNSQIKRGQKSYCKKSCPASKSRDSSCTLYPFECRKPPPPYLAPQNPSRY